MGITLNGEAMSTSDLLKKDDLNGYVTLTIAIIRKEQVGPNKDVEYVARFEGTDKGLVLNKTNQNRIADWHGNVADNWVGKQITIFNDPTVEYPKGTRIGGIRVKEKPPQPSPGELSNHPGAPVEPPPF